MQICLSVAQWGVNGKGSFVWCISVYIIYAPRHKKVCSTHFKSGRNQGHSGGGGGTLKECSGRPLRRTINMGLSRGIQAWGGKQVFARLKGYLGRLRESILKAGSTVSAEIEVFQKGVGELLLLWLGPYLPIDSPSLLRNYPWRQIVSLSRCLESLVELRDAGLAGHYWSTCGALSRVGLSCLGLGLSVAACPLLDTTTTSPASASHDASSA